MLKKPQTKKKTQKKYRKPRGNYYVSDDFNKSSLGNHTFYRKVLKMPASRSDDGSRYKMQRIINASDHPEQWTLSPEGRYLAPNDTMYTYTRWPNNAYSGAQYEQAYPGDPTYEYYKQMFNNIQRNQLAPLTIGEAFKEYINPLNTLFR